VSAEALTAMNERDRAGVILEVKRPIHGGVAAPDNQQVFPVERAFVLDEVVDSAAILKLRDGVIGELVWPERPDAGADDDRPGVVHAAICRQFPYTIFKPSQGLPALVKTEGGVPLPALLDQVAHQVFSQDSRPSWDIIDELLRVEHSELSTGFRQRLHDFDPHPAHPGIESAKQARRPCTKDENVVDIHSPFLLEWQTIHALEVLLFCRYPILNGSRAGYKQSSP